MNILIVGGTVFLGRAIVEAALARGHKLTLFNRGQHNADLFPDVEKLHGDRDGGLDALKGRHWDAVIDTCGYLPRLVRAAAKALAGAVERYVFISTISVYASYATIGIDETAPVGTLADQSIEEITGESYGPLKALCEQAVEQALPGRALIIRPGLIVGPNDPTDRFTYWAARAARGGEVLAPGDPRMHTQVVDVRDLAAWTVRMVEAHATGVYNVTGPTEPVAFAQFLHTCIAEAATDARFTWVSEAFLLAQGVAPWADMPLWLAVEQEPDSVGFGDVSIARALAAGLAFRPLRETIHDTQVWAQTRPADHSWRAGISAEREAELLRAWHAHA